MNSTYYFCMVQSMQILHGIIQSDYSEMRYIGAGADAVDFALVNLCHNDDIVVTQDYGAAAMVLGKGVNAIHQSGLWFMNDNIDQMLMESLGEESAPCLIQELSERPYETNDRG